jgi:hypothetical protein
MLVIVFLGGVFSYYYPIIESRNQYDDSYITYRYAVNLAEEKGLTFNSYERINSYSSLLYTLTLAGFYKIGFYDLERVAMVIGIASSVFVIFFTVLLANRISRKTWLIVMFILPFCISGSFSAWAISGMETVFYMALVILFFYSYAVDKLNFSLFIMALCLVARPEGVILFIAIVMAEIVSSNFKANYGGLLKFVLIGGITFMGWIIWNWAYYGTVLPTPILFKQIALYYSPSLLNSILNVIRFFVGNFVTITIPGLVLSFVVVICGLISWFLRRNAFSHLPSDKIYIALSIFVIGSIASFLLGPSSDFGRYMVHLLPILALLAILCFEIIFRQISPVVLRTKEPAIFCIGMIILLIGCYQSIKEQQRLSGFFERTTAHQGARKKLGEYIEQYVPRDQVIISSDIGAIAYIARNHDFMDVFGLTSKGPIAAIQQNKWENFIQYLKMKKPQWVADTVIPNGKTQSFEILGFPYKYFRGVDKNDKSYINMYSLHNKVVLQIPIDDGYVFHLVKIEIGVYK